MLGAPTAAGVALLIFLSQLFRTSHPVDALTDVLHLVVGEQLSLVAHDEPAQT